MRKKTRLGPAIYNNNFTVLFHPSPPPPPPVHPPVLNGVRYGHHLTALWCFCGFTGRNIGLSLRELSPRQWTTLCLESVVWNVGPLVVVNRDYGMKSRKMSSHLAGFCFVGLVDSLILYILLFLSLSLIPPPPPPPPPPSASSSFIFGLIVWFTGWVIDWLIDWSIDWLI